MGGYKNIKPNEGVPFTTENQPDKEIWNEELAVRLFDDLIEWLNEKDDEGDDNGNMFFKEFFLIECDPKKYHPNAKIYGDLPNYLANKYLTCSKLLRKAKEIQEIKLMKYGVADRLNASMTKFTLINNHGWRDKIETETTNINYNAEVSKDEAKKINDALENDY